LLILSNLQLGFVQTQDFSNYNQELKNETEAIDLVAVQGGKFMMGAEASDSKRIEIGLIGSK
jgi:hypothetical protein